MFNVGDRVERVGKTWGNIGQGALGMVHEVMDFGKKLRVVFDDYISEKADGSVIVLSKSMRRVQFAGGVMTGRVPAKPIYEDAKVIVNAKEPVRGNPFDGVRTHRVKVSEPHRISKPKPTPSVEVIDITKPFHLQVPPRLPDHMHMSDYSYTGDVEGLVGEGYDEDDQHSIAERIDRRLERAAAAPKAERSVRSQIRPLAPYTPWEAEMRKRRFKATEMVQIDTAKGFNACYQQRGVSLEQAIEKTLPIK